MAYKSYLTKDGKKLGPYPHHNSRDKKGKIKSVYLGTEHPDKQGKKAVQKPHPFLPFFILIVFLAIIGGLFFFAQNKTGFFAEEIEENKSNFEVDQILIKVLIKKGEFIDKQIRIMNTGETEADFEVKAEGLQDIVEVKEGFFKIKPGQTKTVNLNFTSVLEGRGIEQAPGVYLGKLIVSSNKFARDIPVIVEIESETVLLDMNLNPSAKERGIPKGEEVTIEVGLFNLESMEPVNVEMNYFVKDLDGNTIITETESVVVKTQASFFKTLNIPPNLKDGNYVFAAQAKYGSSVGTSSYLFEVIGAGENKYVEFVGFCRDDVLCWSISLVLILILVSLGAYFYSFKKAGAKEAKQDSYLRKWKVKSASRKELRERRREERKREKEKSKLKKLKEGADREKEFLKLKEEMEILGGRKGTEKEDNEREGKRRRESEKEKLIREKELEKERLREDITRKKELKRTRAEEEAKRKKTEIERIREERIKQRDAERKKRAEEKRRRELERQKLKEERRKAEEERRSLEEATRKEREKKRKKRREKTKRKIKSFLRKNGMHKTKKENMKKQRKLDRERMLEERRKGEEEEKRLREERIKQREKERESRAENRRKEKAYARRRKEAEKRKKELKRKRAEEEAKRKKTEIERIREERIRQRDAERKKRAEGKRREELERQKLKEERRKAEEERKKIEESRKKEREKGKRREELEKQKIVEGVKEDLEKEGKEKKEKPIKEEVVLRKKIEGKSRKFVRCHNMLVKVKSLIEEGKRDDAKGLYVKARELYIELPYEEKKEIYDGLMEVYNRLSS